MTEKTKSTKPTKLKTTDKGGSTKVPEGVAPFALKYIALEINGGRSSMLLAFAGAIHLNDFLHSAGLITDDAWNAVKGMSTLFSETANVTAIASQVGSVLKTVVEGAAGLETAGAGAAASTAKSAQAQQQLEAAIYSDVEP
jgi:hypothetical protein